MPIEKHLETGGGRIRYCEAGAGDAVVMLRDGDGFVWSTLHDLLAERRRVIAPELPGFRPSSADRRSPSPRELARTMTAFAAGLGLESYRLVATGFSARIALWQTIDSPDRIETLALIAPAAILPDDWRPSAATSEPMAKRSEPNRDPELEGSLGGIKAPVLAIFGTRDAVIAPETGRLYRERIPNCYYVLMYDAGHAIAAERPQALAQLLGDFLERGEAFVVNRTSGLINP
jgi:pimeloyl-ACP methyl ester carboxylesterase